MEDEEKRAASDHKQTEMEPSPRRSPLRSHQEEAGASPPKLPEKSPCKMIIPVDRYSHGFLPFRSPPEDRKPVTPPETTQARMPVKPASPGIMVNRSMGEEMSSVKKADPGGGGGGDGFTGGVSVEDGVYGRSRSVSSILWRSKREGMVRRAALGFRICEVVFCLVSFSVMAADRTQGWSGDSFDRYKEYRYCISVTIIAFVYAGFQAYDLAYHLITGKHIIQHHLRLYFDFSMDQILAYFLVSASSSAAARVDDWQTNWGKDEFTEKASASVGMSFLAFVAFAISSLISGYNLCTRNLT